MKVYIYVSRMFHKMGERVTWGWRMNQREQKILILFRDTRYSFRIRKGNV